MNNSPINDYTIRVNRRSRLAQQILAKRKSAAAKGATAQPPIHLCRLRGGDYEYLTGYDGDAVVIRECPNKETIKGDWENGRTICCEKRERAQDVFALCALLNFFKEEIPRLNDAWDIGNGMVNKALSHLVAERRCRPSDRLIQIEPEQAYYTGKEDQDAAHGKSLQSVDLYRDYANDGAAAKGAANHEGK
jgi:hypothetical protein